MRKHLFALVFLVFALLFTLYPVFPQVTYADPTIFQDGFESGNFSAWTGTTIYGATLTVVAEKPHHGTYSAKATITSNNGYASFYKDFSSPPTTVHARFYVYISSLTVSSGGYFDVGSWWDASASVAFFTLRVYGTSRQLQIVYYVGSTSYTATSSTTLALNTWHCLEMKYVKSSTAGEYRVWLNGAEVTALTQTNKNTIYTPYRWRSIRATLSMTGTIYHDCVVIADTYIGPEVLKQWNNVATWSFQVLTRQWVNVASWNLELLTRQWIVVGTWTQTLVARTWQSITDWMFTLPVSGWHLITQWTLNAFTPTWRTITEWIINLGKQWQNITVWITEMSHFQDPLLIFGIFGFIFSLIAIAIAILWSPKT